MMIPVEMTHLSFAFALALLVCPAATSHLPQTGDDPVTTVGPADNGRRVVLSTGDTLLVRLDSQPGTGYGWKVVANDGRRLVPAGGGAEGQRAGEGEREAQVFRFKARARGSHTLRLNYVRPWQKNAAPLKTYSLVVVVRRPR